MAERSGAWPSSAGHNGRAEQGMAEPSGAMMAEQGMIMVERASGAMMAELNLGGQARVCRPVPFWFFEGRSHSLVVGRHKAHNYKGP